MDNKDKDINSNPEVVQTLSGILKAGFVGLPPVVNVIGILMILMAFISLLILPFLGYSWLAFLVVMFAIILMAILIYWIGHLFQQRREHDAQVINACKEIQKSLRRLINPKASSSIIAILPVVGKILQQVSKCLKNPKQQREADEKLTGLLNGWKEIIAESKVVVDQVAIWLEAGRWLEQHRNELINKAVDEVSKKYPWLVENNKQQFKNGVYEHIKWVQENLDNADNFIAVFKELDISKLDLPFRGESYVYRETFEFLEKDITIRGNLPPTTKEVLLDFIRAIVYEYNS